MTNQESEEEERMTNQESEEEERVTNQESEERESGEMSPFLKGGSLYGSLKRSSPITNLDNKFNIYEYIYIFTCTSHL